MRQGTAGGMVEGCECWADAQPAARVPWLHPLLTLYRCTLCCLSRTLCSLRSKTSGGGTRSGGGGGRAAAAGTAAGTAAAAATAASAAAAAAASAGGHAAASGANSAAAAAAAAATGDAAGKKRGLSKAGWLAGGTPRVAGCCSARLLTLPPHVASPLLPTPCRLPACPARRYRSSHRSRSRERRPDDRRGERGRDERGRDARDARRDGARRVGADRRRDRSFSPGEIREEKRGRPGDAGDEIAQANALRASLGLKPLK